MKIRTGFVSNSSSSSFICDISGEIESGWDMSLDEAGMYSCERGHTFDRRYAVYESMEHLPVEVKNKLVAKFQIIFPYDDPTEERRKEYYEKIKTFLKETSQEQLDEMWKNEEYDEEAQYGYEVPREMCPICSFKEISLNDVEQYLYRKLGKTKEEVIKDIKSTFKDYTEFNKYINGNEDGKS